MNLKLFGAYCLEVCVEDFFLKDYLCKSMCVIWPTTQIFRNKKFTVAEENPHKFIDNNADSDLLEIAVSTILSGQFTTHANKSSSVLAHVVFCPLIRGNRSQNVLSVLIRIPFPFVPQLW